MKNKNDGTAQKTAYKGVPTARFLILSTLLIVVLMVSARVLSIIYSSVENDILFPELPKYFINYGSLALKIIYKALGMGAIIYAVNYIRNGTALAMSFISSGIVLIDFCISFVYDVVSNSIAGREFLALFMVLLQFVFFTAVIFITFLAAVLMNKPKKAKNEAKKVTIEPATSAKMKKKLVVLACIPCAIVVLYRIVFRTIELFSDLAENSYAMTGKEALYLVSEYLVMLVEYGVLPVLLIITFLYIYYRCNRKYHRDINV